MEVGSRSVFPVWHRVTLLIYKQGYRHQPPLLFPEFVRKKEDLFQDLPILVSLLFHNYNTDFTMLENNGLYKPTGVVM